MPLRCDPLGIDPRALIVFVSAYSGEGFSPLFFLNGEAERHRSMAQAPPKPVWHLLRTGERPCVVSDQELLVLAELGHLRADDSLWRPDFHGYRTVRSLLGHGRVAPAPSLILLSERSKRINVEAIPDFLGPVETTAPAQKLRSATLGGANRHIKLVGVVGLLIVVALVGVLGLAMHSSLAIESQPAIQSTAFAEPGFASAEPHSASTPVQQPNSPATAKAGSFSGSTDQVEVEQGRLIVRKVRIVDIDVSQVSDASALVPNSASEAPKSVPLPIKKPAIPIQSLSSR